MVVSVYIYLGGVGMVCACVRTITVHLVILQSAVSECRRNSSHSPYQLPVLCVNAANKTHAYTTPAPPTYMCVVAGPIFCVERSFCISHHCTPPHLSTPAPPPPLCPLPHPHLSAPCPTPPLQYCDKCNALRDSEKWFQLQRLPEILVLRILSHAHYWRKECVRVCVCV